MNLQKIYYFVKLAETLNFKRAADELFVSRQALSKQIGLLENEIGACLIERETNRVVVTEIGQKVYEIYKPIIQDIINAGEEVERFVRYKNNYLKIAYFDALPSDIFIDPWIEKWKKAFPDSVVNLIAAEAGIDRELIMNDSVDLLMTAILDPSEWTGVEVIPLFWEEMKIVVSENHPWYKKDAVTEEEIAQAAMLVFGNRPMSEERAFLPAIRPRERIVMYNSSSYMANLRLGYAFGVMTKVHASGDGDFRLLDLPGDLRCDMEFALVFKRFHPLADKMRKIGRILQEQLKNDTSGCNYETRNCFSGNGENLIIEI